MGEKVHPSLQNHPLRAELVELDVEIDIALGPFALRSAHCLKPLDELPGNASYHELAVEGELAYRSHEARHGHTAQEAVTLYYGGLCPLPCSRHRSDESGRPAAAHHYVVAACIRGFHPEPAVLPS